MKKALVFVLVSVLMLSLAACGGSAEPDPNAGLYEAVSAEMSGISIKVESVFPDGFSLELKNGGKATFHYDGKDYGMKWTLDGKSFHAEGGGAKLDGTLADGTMILQNVLDSGVSITLVDKSHSASAPTEEKSAAEPDPNAGVYDAVSAEAGGISVDISSVYKDGFSLELQNGEDMVFQMDGVDFSIKYTLDGDKLHTEGSLEFNGTLSDGVLILENPFGNGYNLKLVKRDHPPAEETESSAAAETETKPYADALNWWNGRWYGWYVVYLAGGSYEDEEDTAFDVLAEIDVDADGGTVEMWETDTDRDDLFALVDVRFEPDGGTENGKLISLDGQCWEDTVEPDEWSLDPASHLMSRFENVICAAGRYTDEDDADSWYEYLIFLRPWGTDWEDVRSGDISDMPYDDMMPLHYDDWYVPQIKDAVQTSSEPAQTSSELHPNEPSSDGDGRTTMENILRFYKWIDTVDYELKKNMTYADMVEIVGVEGEDCGNTGPNSVSELGDHYFNWYGDDTHFIHMGFRARSDGRWTYCGMNTSNITKADYEGVDISDLLP